MIHSTGRSIQRTTWACVGWLSGPRPPGLSSKSPTYSQFGRGPEPIQLHESSCTDSICRRRSIAFCICERLKSCILYDRDRRNPPSLSSPKALKLCSLSFENPLAAFSTMGTCLQDGRPPKCRRLYGTTLEVARGPVLTLLVTGQRGLQNKKPSLYLCTSFTPP